jgi:hypothetical protein
MSIAEKKLFLPALIISIFSLSFVLRYLAYAQTNYATGWDNYFYIIQIKSYIENGYMHSSRISLFYPLLIGIQFFAHDYILTTKIAACLIVSSFAVMMFLLALKLSQRNIVASIIVGVYFVFSPQLTYYGAQFTHNLLGALLFIIFFYFLILEKKMYAMISFGAILLVHKLTAGLSLVCLLIWVLLRMKMIKHYKYFVYGIIAIIIVGLLAVSVFNTNDWARDEHVFSNIPSIPTYSFLKSFSDILNSWWTIEILLSALLFLSALVYHFVLKKGNDINAVLYLSCLLLLYFPFLTWSINGFAYRFFMLFSILAPLLLIYFTSYIKKGVSMSLSLVLIAASFVSYKSYNPEFQDPSYQKYEFISKIIDQKKSRINFELIIAHKCLAEYISYSTGIDAIPWVPEYEIKKNRLWRIVHGLKAKTARYYSGDENSIYVEELTPNYILIRDDVWKNCLLKMKVDDLDLYEEIIADWMNPQKVRPAFLIKN